MHLKANLLFQLRLFSIAILPLGLTLQATAQAPDEQGVFFDAVSVDIVNVEVFVTNKKDVPVTGLAAEDFELFVDGKLTPLSNFYAEAGGTAVSLSSGQEKAVEIPKESNPATPEKASAQQLHLMVFIDNLNMRPVNRKRVFKYLREFLSNSLDPEDLVAVASLDTNLVFRTEFVRDRSYLNRVLDEVEKVGSPNAALSSERQRIFNDIQTDQLPSAKRSIFSRIQVAARSKFRSGKASAEALGVIVNSLAGIPGRRAILQVGDGVPTNPGESMYLAWSNRFGADGPYSSAIGPYDLMRDFQELARRANAARVTFYTLDAEADYRSFARSGSFAGGVENYVTATVIEIAESNARAPLELAAVDTGGRRVQASGRFAQNLAKLGNDFASYYSLGFSAPQGSNRAKHRIEVKVAGKGLRVRHRQAYEDKGADRRSGEAVIAALLYNTTANPLGVGLEKLALGTRDDGAQVLPVKVKIPISRVGFLPQGDQHSAQLSFFVTVKDARGNLRPVQKVPFKLRIPADRFEAEQDTTADYELPVVLHAGDQQVAIGVRDEIGGTSSTLRLELPQG
ncbi:MAG: VWA domain-containing protein [Deltaproteobacteria bacterium]|nr:VWA domain-containing protein [Deltaproteobacteria bacterium]